MPKRRKQPQGFGSNAKCFNLNVFFNGDDYEWIKNYAKGKQISMSYAVANALQFYRSYLNSPF